jgi:hypothetical protein
VYDALLVAVVALDVAHHRAVVPDAPATASRPDRWEGTTTVVPEGEPELLGC